MTPAMTTMRKRRKLTARAAIVSIRFWISTADSSWAVPSVASRSRSVLTMPRTNTRASRSATQATTTMTIACPIGAPGPSRNAYRSDHGDFEKSGMLVRAYRSVAQPVGQAARASATIGAGAGCSRPPSCRVACVSWAPSWNKPTRPPSSSRRFVQEVGGGHAHSFRSCAQGTQNRARRAGWAAAGFIGRAAAGFIAVDRRVSAVRLNGRVSEPFRVSFAADVRSTRLALDVTQGELATAARISRAYLASIEVGRANPTLDVAERLAEALGLELRLLAGPIIPEPRQRDLVQDRKSVVE